MTLSLKNDETEQLVRKLAEIATLCKLNGVRVEAPMRENGSIPG